MSFKDKARERCKKIRDFLKEDSWPSFFVNLVIALVVIKFIVFPILTLVTGTSLPLVIVESCSMYHQYSMENIIQNKIYSDNNISFGDSAGWVLKNGFNKGDIIFVVGAKNLKVGDVLIFNAGRGNPIIHRIIKIDDDGNVTTKGDNNLGLLDVEKEISPDQFVGKAVFKVPVVGWIKLIFFDWMKPSEQRGFC